MARSSSSSVLSPVRTYAHDLDDAREKRRVPKTATTNSNIKSATASPVVLVHHHSDNASVTPITTTPSLSTTAQPTKTVTATAIKSAASEKQPSSYADTTTPKHPAEKPLPDTPVLLTATNSRDTSYEATIITDAKHKRFRLFPAIAEATTNWWQDKQQQKRDKNKPTYTVPSVEHRKGIVEKATSVTARGTTQDHAAIVARLKTEKEERLKSGAGVPPPQAVSKPLPTPTWDTDTAISKVVATGIDPVHSLSLDTATASDVTPINVVKETAPNTTATENNHRDTTTTNSPTTMPDTDTTRTTNTNISPTAPVTKKPATPDRVPTILSQSTNEPESMTSPTPTIDNEGTKVTTTTTVDITPSATAIPISNVVVVPRIKPKIPQLATRAFTHEEDAESDNESLDTAVIESTGVITEHEDSVIPLASDATDAVFDATEEELPTGITITPIKIKDRIVPMIPTPYDVPTPPATPMSVTENVIATPAPRTVEDIAPTLSPSVTAVKDAVSARKEVLREQAITTASLPAKRRLTLPVIAPYLVAGIFILITVGTISYFVVTSTATINETVPPTNGTTLPTTPITTGSNTSLPQSAVSARLATMSRSALYTALTIGTETESFITVTPLHPNTGLPLTTREILNIINRQLPADFIGETTSLITGSYRGAPVIVIITNNYDVAKGSMYGWEDTLSSDLAPWFGPTIRSLATSSQPVGFTDSSYNQYDIRTLTNGVNQLLYTVTMRGTIIITTTDMALSNLLSSYGN